MVRNRKYFRRGENTRGILSGPTAGGKTTLRKSLLREWDIFDIDPLRMAIELEAEKKGVAVDEAEIERILREQNDRFRDEGEFIVETTLQSAKALEFAIERNTHERREINLLVVLAETFEEHDERYRIRSEGRGRACTVAQADNAHLGRLRTLGNCGLLVRHTYETNIVRTFSEDGVLAELELLASYERRTNELGIYRDERNLPQTLAYLLEFINARNEQIPNLDQSPNIEIAWPKRIKTGFER